VRVHTEHVENADPLGAGLSRAGRVQTFIDLLDEPFEKAVVDCLGHGIAVLTRLLLTEGLLDHLAARSDGGRAETLPQLVRVYPQQLGGGVERAIGNRHTGIGFVSELNITQMQHGRGNLKHMLHLLRTHPERMQARTQLCVAF
jgi:hypothetical protein